MSKKKDFTTVIGGAVEQTKTFEEIVKENIVIREELKNFIPPLTTEEFAQLEDNIKKEGCRDALILWQDGDKYVLVDGHNRYAICTKNKIDFNFKVLDFKAGVGQVTDWMIANQLGKRNITELSKSYLRGKRYEIEKQKEKNTKGLKQFATVEDKMSTTGKTSEKLAEEYKVSEKTIQRDAEYARAVDKIAEGNEPLKWQILNKEIEVPKNLIVEFAEKSEAEIQVFRKKLESGDDIKPIAKKIEIKPLEPKLDKTERQKKLAKIKRAFNKHLEVFEQEPDKEIIEGLKKLVADLEKLIDL